MASLGASGARKEGWSCLVGSTVEGVAENVAEELVNMETSLGVCRSRCAPEIKGAARKQWSL